MTRTEIAEVLKKERKKAGLTQKQAATAIGRKQQTLASWETARAQPDANTLFELCSVYGVSVDEAFGFIDKNKDIKNSISNDEIELIKLCRCLSDEGITKLSDYVKDLCSIEKYKKNNHLSGDITTETKFA